jgi:biotin carboxyl carrier protein
MKYTVRSTKKHTFEIDNKNDFSTEVQVSLNKKQLNIKVEKYNSDGSIRTVRINNKMFPVQIVKREDGFPGAVILNGVSYPVAIEKVESTRYRPPTAPRNISGALKANLPGQILSFLVQQGDLVKKGQPLVILEAMKMENELLAPRDGIVKEIHTTQNQLVMRGDLILELE